MHQEQEKEITIRDEQNSMLASEEGGELGRGKERRGIAGILLQSLDYVGSRFAISGARKIKR